MSYPVIKSESSYTSQASIYEDDGIVNRYYCWNRDPCRIPSRKTPWWVGSALCITIGLLSIAIMTGVAVFVIKTPPIPSIQNIRRPDINLFKNGNATVMTNVQNTEIIRLSDDTATIISSHKTCAHHLKNYPKLSVIQMTLWLLICGTFEDPHLGGFYGGGAVMGILNGEKFYVSKEVRIDLSITELLNTAQKFWHAGTPAFLHMIYFLLSKTEDNGASVRQMLMNQITFFGTTFPTQMAYWRYIQSLMNAPYLEVFPGRNTNIHKIFAPVSNQKSILYETWLNMTQEFYANSSDTTWFDMGSIPWRNNANFDFNFFELPFLMNGRQSLAPNISDNKHFSSGRLPIINNAEIAGHHFPFNVEFVSMFLHFIDPRGGKALPLFKEFCGVSKNNSIDLSGCAANLAHLLHHLPCKTTQSSFVQNILASSFLKGQPESKTEFQDTKTECRALNVINRGADTIIVVTNLGKCGGSWEIGTVTQQMMNSVMSDYFEPESSNFCSWSLSEYVPAKYTQFTVKNTDNSEYLVYAAGNRMTESCFKIIDILTNDGDFTKICSTIHYVGDEDSFLVMNSTMMAIGGVRGRSGVVLRI